MEQNHQHEPYWHSGIIRRVWTLVTYWSGKSVNCSNHLGLRFWFATPTLKDLDLRHGETLVTLEQGLAQASVITLHANGDKTILDKNAFDLMHRGVILLNSARAGLVDEQAFLGALSAGKVAGAWFDAFWQEPYNGELLGYPNVLLTPHVCTYTRQCRLGMETEAVKNLMRDLGIN